MSSFSTSGLPPIDQALEPASVRNGTPAAQKAYQTGLAFEQVLVDELSKELAATASGSGSSDSSGGLLGSGTDPANNAYAQLLPSALTSGLMAAGGTGIAQQLAGALDPSIATNAAAAVTPSTGGASTGGAAVSAAATAATPATSASGGVAPSAATATTPATSSTAAASTIAPAATSTTEAPEASEGSGGKEVSGAAESGEDGA